MTNSWAGNIAKLSAYLKRDCGFFTLNIFLVLGQIFRDSLYMKISSFSFIFTQVFHVSNYSRLHYLRDFFIIISFYCPKYLAITSIWNKKNRKISRKDVFHKSIKAFWREIVSKIFKEFIVEKKGNPIWHAHYSKDC